MNKDRKLAYLALFVSSLIWGMAPPIIKYTLGFISPASFLFYRFLLATIIIAIPLALRLKKLRPNSKDFLLYLFLGFLCTPLNLVFLFWGIEKTTAIDASLISIISPILVVLGGVIFLKEVVTKKESFGIGIALAGTLLTLLQPLLENGLGGNLWGNFLVFLGALVGVVFTLLAKKYHHLDPFLLSAISFVVGLIVLAPLTSYLSLPTLPALPGLVFMAIFSSVVAYFAYSFGLSKIEASEATVFTYLQPLFSIPLAVILLQEKLSLPFAVGASLILIGVLFCEQRTGPEKAG